MTGKDTAETMSGVVRTYPLYKTSLGDALFTGEDIFTTQLRSNFSEMLLQHLSAGGRCTLLDLGNTLATFTPLCILDSSEEWKDRMQRDWSLQKQRMFAALEGFFLNGGADARVDQQLSLLADLELAGIEIKGKVRLSVEILFAGDWRQGLLRCVEFGQETGITFATTAAFDEMAAKKALLNAGFSSVLSDCVLANLRHAE